MGRPLAPRQGAALSALLLSLLLGNAGRALREGTSRRGGWRKPLAAEDREGFLPLYKGLMCSFYSVGDTGQGVQTRVLTHSEQETISSCDWAARCTAKVIHAGFDKR